MEEGMYLKEMAAKHHCQEQQGACAAGEYFHLAHDLNSLEALQGCGFSTHEETDYMSTGDKMIENWQSQEAIRFFPTQFCQWKTVVMAKKEVLRDIQERDKGDECIKKWATVDTMCVSHLPTLFLTPIPAALPGLHNGQLLLFSFLLSLISPFSVFFFFLNLIHCNINLL